MDNAEYQYVELDDGFTLHYREQGEGPPLVLIPGWTMTLAVFERNIDQLANHYQVLAIDPRSQGRSDKTLAGNNYIQHGKDLAAFFDALSLRSINLVGWSTGALTAYSYFEQFGTDRVRAFVNIDMAPKPVKANPDDWGNGQREEVRALVASLTSPDQTEFMRQYASHGFLEGAADDEFVDAIVELSRNTPAAQAALLLADGNLADYSDIACKIAKAIPVLHILSNTVAPAAIDWLGRNAPQALHVALGSHMMFWEYSERVNAELLAFLEINTEP